MHGWLSSASSGPLTWMLSSATLTAWITTASITTAWITQHQRKRGPRRSQRGPNRERDKGGPNENQTDLRICGRPEQRSALLYGAAGLCQEGRLQSGPISLADRGLARGARRHRTAAGAEQQPRSQSVSAGDVSTAPASGHVLHRRRAGRLRAYESARRRVHHATKGRDGLQDRHAERHLRQSHSGHAADALVGRTPVSR